MARITALLAIVLASSWILSGCGSSAPHREVVAVTSVQTADHGPPSHAPAHGYRQKHGEVDLIYDSGLQVYVVMGTEGRYFWEGNYYRCQGKHWMRSQSLRGPWKRTAASRIPSGLVTKGKRVGATANE